VPTAVPSAMVAVTTTVPVPVAVNVFPLIDAPVLPALLTDQTISLRLALAGKTVPVSSDMPTGAVAGTWVMAPTGIKSTPGGRSLTFPIFTK